MLSDPNFALNPLTEKKYYLHIQLVILIMHLHYFCLILIIAYIFQLNSSLDYSKKILGKKFTFTFAALCVDCHSCSLDYPTNDEFCFHDMTDMTVRLISLLVSDQEQNEN